LTRGIVPTKCRSERPRLSRFEDPKRARFTTSHEATFEARLSGQAILRILDRLLCRNRGVSDPSDARGVRRRALDRGRSRHGSSSAAIGTADRAAQNAAPSLRAASIATC